MPDAKNKKYSVSVFFPCYKDEATIEKMVLDAIETLKPIAKNYEVIVVDDASPDNAGKIADSLAKRFKEVKVVHHPQNRGYGGALRSGFKTASKELVFYTDGDAQYDPKEMVKLFDYIDDYDVVNGCKVGRQDNIVRIVMGKAYNWFARWLIGLKVKDVDCDFRLIKKKVIDSMEPLEYSSGAICIELMKKIQNTGATIKNVPVHHYSRVAGASTFFRPGRIYKTLRDMVRLWFSQVLFKKQEKN